MEVDTEVLSNHSPRFSTRAFDPMRIWPLLPAALVQVVVPVVSSVLPPVKSCTPLSVIDSAPLKRVVPVPVIVAAPLPGVLKVDAPLTVTVPVPLKLPPL